MNGFEADADQLSARAKEFPGLAERVGTIHRDLTDTLSSIGPCWGNDSVGQSFVIILRNNVESPLKDARVRQAMNYAIDKDVIVKQLIGGYAQKLEGQMLGPSG